MSEGSFSKNSLITLFSDVLVFVFGIVYMIILARVLGPEGKGIYSLILLIPGLMMLFGGFGIESANVYLVGSKKHKIKEVVSNSLVLSVVLGFILVIVFWGTLYFSFFDKFIAANKIPIFYMWLIVLTIPFYFISIFFKNALRGYGEIQDYNKVKIAEGIALLLAGIVFLLFLKQALFGAVMSYIVSIFSAAICSIFLLKKYINIFPLSFNSNLLRDSLSYGGKVYLANTLSFLNYRLDMFLIAIFLTPYDVGIYSIAVAVAEKLLIVPGALSTVLFPKISSIGEDEANHLTAKISRHAFLIIIVICVLLLVSANLLITIFFGDAFLPSVLPLLVLLPGIVAFSVGGVLAADLSGRGKPQFAIYSSLTALVANIILNVILIPRWGITGAALASSISYWLDTIIILFAFTSISKTTLREIFLIKKQDFIDYYGLLRILLLVK